MRPILPWFAAIFCLFAASGLASPAAASEGMPGQDFGLVWCLPFAGILLAIALLPLLARDFWHRHFGKVSLFFALAFLIPYAIQDGADAAFGAFLHTMLFEYLPFIVLLFALFVAAGGILVRGEFSGTPGVNTGLLGFGTLIASAIGTTGAAMVLIRPLIRANRARKRNAHVFVFFIFLVANIGGALTPLGDPPLFLGFLKGVDFLWTMEHMFLPMALNAAILLVLFYVVDTALFRGEKTQAQSGLARDIKIEGLRNVFYLALIVAVVLASGVVSTGVTLDIFGQNWPLENLLRGTALLTISALAYASTPKRIRIENAFTWEPIREVATLFFGIFVAMIPALAILKAGEAGPAAPLLKLVTHEDGSPNEAMYFWLTGGLSSFLDNAPTYLVFFNLAGGDAQALMGPLAGVLLAISCGAVFMGANTYIGNAPNFMVKSICEEKGIKMPSFFGFMGWSILILVPCFALTTYVFFG